jgi:putative endonuclease
VRYRQGSDYWIPAFAGMTAAAYGKVLFNTIACHCPALGSGFAGPSRNLTGQSSTPQTWHVSEHVYYVDILASHIGGTLYVGVTNDLVRRVYEHREKQAEGFTAKYGVSRLVYFEPFGDITLAVQREKQLKRWKRAWKVELLEAQNPNWDDLYPSIASP